MLEDAFFSCDTLYIFHIWEKFMVSYERLNKILFSYEGITISWPVGVPQSNTILTTINFENNL